MTCKCPACSGLNSFSLVCMPPNMSHHPVPSSSTSFSLHPASLVPPYVHDPALLEMLSVHVNEPFIDYVVDCVVANVQYVLERSWGNSGPYHLKQAPFVQFVNNVLHVSKCPTPTILVALVYLRRARNQMQITKGDWACERAFLGALILANKYTNDQNYNHKSWAQASRIFLPREVSRIEREMLMVLQYELSVRSEDITSHYTAMMTKCRQPVSARPCCVVPSQSFRAPLPAYNDVMTSSWSPSSSSTSSTSPYESPALMTPELYLPAPPYDRSAHHQTAPVITASGSLPHLLAGGYKEQYSSLTGSQGAERLAHDLLYPQSLHPPNGSNEIFFGDATDFDSYALSGLLQQPDAHLPTLPHLSEVVPTSTLLSHRSASSTHAPSNYPGYPQLPALQATAPPRKELSTIPHSFGDLTYVW